MTLISCAWRSRRRAALRPQARCRWAPCSTQGDAILAVAAIGPSPVTILPRTPKSKRCGPGVAPLNSYRLNGTTLYVTLEPCVMCASAIVHARVARLVFGAWDPKAGAAGSTTNVFTLPSMNHRVDVFGGVLMEESARLLNGFFATRRSETP